jgi:iron(III) transport system substrate-binding protein
MFVGSVRKEATVTRFNFGVFLGALAVPLLLNGCGSRGPAPATVVVYTSVDDVFARPLAERFEKETGIQVKLVPDTEETKSTGLLNRLLAEKDRPQADVFWSGDPVRPGILKKRGVTAPYRSPAAEGLPSQYADPEHHWTGFSARARVLLANTHHAAFKKAPLPTSVRDLADPRYKGQACVANPLFSTAGMHAAALFQVLGETEAKKFFEDLLTNQTRMLSSNGEVRRRVADGEFAFGLTDTDDAAEAIRDGKPVQMILPDEQGMGTLVVPNAAVLIAGGPNPDNGKRFIDYLLRPETEAALAEGEAAQMPLRPGVPVPKGVVNVKDLKPMKVDYAKLADILEDVSKGYLRTGWIATASNSHCERESDHDSDRVRQSDRAGGRGHAVCLERARGRRASLGAHRHDRAKGGGGSPGPLEC